MSTGVADNLAMFQAAASIIIVYTQADIVQPAYTGTQADLIICRCRQIPFHTVRILGEYTFSATDRFPLFAVSV
jgi:hypothetical protein